MTISLDTLKETEVINYEIVTKIIKELTEKLNESIVNELYEFFSNEIS